MNWTLLPGRSHPTLNSQNNVSHLGLDSLMALQFNQQLFMDLGIDISMEKLLEGMTIADLASYLEAQIGASIGGEELPT
ncbi:MAG: acyl carrier protein [Hormoscilla sp. SP5CHS1]|nr:acyl carrier protein [Hormoscilla sp. SP12CHS1]MBC6455694.1 acyl carrier protein [Hormoscilla sp. SP5CHS1]